MDALAWIKEVFLLYWRAYLASSVGRDFRTKTTKKLTHWGRLSLAGLIVASLGAMFTQYVAATESAQRAQKSADDTTRTLSLLQKSISSVHDMQLHVRFKVPCNDEPIAQFL